MKGKVKFFDSGRGFGFITAEDGKEIFVHHSGLKEGVTLNENDAVTFDVEQGDRGPKAVNVALDKGEAEEAPEEEKEEEAPEEKAEEAPEEEKEEASEESEKEPKAEEEAKEE